MYVLSESTTTNSNSCDHLIPGRSGLQTTYIWLGLNTVELLGTRSSQIKFDYSFMVELFQQNICLLGLAALQTHFLAQPIAKVGQIWRGHWQAGQVALQGLLEPESKLLE